MIYFLKEFFLFGFRIFIYLTALGLSWDLCFIMRDLFVLCTRRYLLHGLQSTCRCYSHGLGCSTAWGILFPQPGIKPTSLHCKTYSLSLDHRKSSEGNFIVCELYLLKKRTNWHSWSKLKEKWTQRGTSSTW